MATGGLDQTVRLWQAGAVEHTLKAHSFGVVSLDVSPDGQHVVSAGLDATALVSSAATGRQEHPLDANAGEVFRFQNSILFLIVSNSPSHFYIVIKVLAVAFSADGRRVAGGGRSGQLQEWNASTGARVRTLETGAAGGRQSVCTAVA